MDIVRDLTEKQKEIMAKRLKRVAAAARGLEAAKRELDAASADYEECLALITGGDPMLGVSLKAGVVVRKVETNG